MVEDDLGVKWMASGSVGGGAKCSTYNLRRRVKHVIMP